jgi:RNA polymerase sigma-70 factor (ECF subfamily)
MTRQASFDNLMAGLRDGRNEAAAQVFQRFANRLIVLARKQLDTKVLQKEDPEDVMQSVFRSFLARNAAGQFGELATWDNIWAILVVITRRKCGRRTDYFHAACRDVRRETPAPSASGDTISDSAGLPDEEPTPFEAAVLAETVEQLLGNLEGRQRDILTLSLQGFTPVEISARLGCTERTVYRVLDRVKEWLEARRESE